MKNKMARANHRVGSVISATIVVLTLIVILAVRSQAQIGISTTDFPLQNLVVEASAVDSVESNFILGASNLRLPTPLVPFPVTSGELTFESSDARDDVGDIGANLLFLEAIYEITAGEYTLERGAILLNGVTTVGTVLISEQGITRIFALGEPIPPGAIVLNPVGARRIRRSRVLTAGDQEIDQPQGVITLSIGGVPCSEVLAGRGRSEVAVWTTGPLLQEQFSAIGVGIQSASGGGMDWQIESTLYTREFPMGAPWIASFNIRAREPAEDNAVVLGRAFPLHTLTDIRYRIGTTSGANRTIDFVMQITGVE